MKTEDFWQRVCDLSSVLNPATESDWQPTLDRLVTHYWRYPAKEREELRTNVAIIISRLSQLYARLG